ncbi:chemotaxis protein CheX [Desulfuribacillus alkaliarsenatis]|uniref:Chemotaxis phosphatase CheX-like domain-containing protein n=1 Tax=Desulfuribacillus alkaliarsenatis TaxID=766136 RepID=A0A1E5G5V4_9FIRM|nr:chemotaxis protein CheX [Desulfuribacillus alkaliarsenatis]OEF98587.1 hypothetical protein BHF68_02685 [Desulfuribacillus alkaliarsenatis]
MKAEFINPFIQSFSRIFKTQFNQEVEIGQISLTKAPIISNDISVVIGITTDMSGQIIFAMEENAAKYICSTMMMGMEVAEIDDMARSAIQEFFNWVCGHSAEEFLQIDPPHTIDITPPMFNVGKVEMYAAAGVILLVPLKLQNDSIVELYVSLKSKVVI